MLIVQIHGFSSEEQPSLEAFLLKVIPDRHIDQFQVETVWSRVVGPSGYQAGYVHMMADPSVPVSSLIEIEESISFAGYDVLVGYVDRHLPAMIRTQAETTEEPQVIESVALADTADLPLPTHSAVHDEQPLLPGIDLGQDNAPAHNFVLVGPPLGPNEQPAYHA